MLETFEVLNVKCSGCANTLSKALSNDGFVVVDIDLNVVPRKVTLQCDDNFDKQKLMMALRRVGYPLVDDELSALENVSAKAKSFVSCAIGKMS